MLGKDRPRNHAKIEIRGVLVVVAEHPLTVHGQAHLACRKSIDPFGQTEPSCKGACCLISSLVVHHLFQEGHGLFTLVGDGNTSQIITDHVTFHTPDQSQEHKVDRRIAKRGSESNYIQATRIIKFSYLVGHLV